MTVSVSVNNAYEKLYTFAKYNFDLRKQWRKAGPWRYKKITNKLKIRILSQTSILYLIRLRSVILIVGLHL